MKYKSLNLPPEEINRIENFKTFGEKWVIEAIDRAKASLYIKITLNKINETTATPFRCYVEGVNTFERIDGQPITQDDIHALRNYPLGQGNVIIGKPGEKQVKQKWFCDSSD